VWRAEYDARGLSVTRTGPDGGAVRYAYDLRGHLTQASDAAGGVTRVICDAAGLPVEVVDPVGSVTRVARDAFGRPVSVVDPVGSVTRLSWSVEGLLTGRIDPDGAVWAWSYDGEDNLRGATDPVGRITRYDPTPFDQTARVQASDGAVTQYVYDTERRLAAVVNPQGLVWQYVRDGAGRVVAETDFDGATTTYERDAAGQLVGRTNAAGETVASSYDRRGNLVATGPVGGEQTRYTYDVNGRLTRATTPDADLTLTRDVLGRVTAETLNGRAVTSGYDAVGRRVQRRTPSGAVSSWTFDAAGRPVALAAGPVLEFDWDPAGSPTGVRFGNTALRQRFDVAGRLQSQTLTVGTPDGAAARPEPGHAALPATGRTALRRDFEYTVDGYLSEIDDLASGIRRYGCDHAGRVVDVRGPLGHETYGYDVAGNIVEAGWPGAASAGPTGGDAEDPGARGPREYVGSRIRRAGRFSYEHDPAGRLVRRRQRLLSGGTREWRYTWDAQDRLIGVTTPDGATWRYGYDALGRRIAKQRLAEAGDGRTSVVAETVFVWDGPTLVETEDHGSDVVTTFDYQPGTFTPVSQRTRRPAEPGEGRDQAWYDEQFRAIVTDLVGTPTDLVDVDGRVTPQPPSTVWGRAVHTGDGAEAFCPLRFPGQYYDAETGQSYNLFRVYDPDAARYTSPDPLGLAGGPNPHAYVPNPLHWLDPLGLTNYPAAEGATREMTVETGSFEQARNSALDFLGEVDPATRVPLVGRLEAATATFGKRVGFTTRVDGKFKQFRMDYDPEKGAHINVMVGKGAAAPKWAVKWPATEEEFSALLRGNA
jgi:RHS repeat-associated protein